MQWKGRTVFFAIAIFIVKVLGGVANAMVNKAQFNSGDSIIYFLQSKKLQSLFFTDYNRFWQLFFSFNTGKYPESAIGDVYIHSLYWTNNGAFFLCKINTIIHFISCNNLFIHTLFFSFLSYFACVLIYNAIQSLYNTDLFLLALFLGLYPTLNYWGVAIHKECLMLLFFGIICFATIKFTKNKNIWYVILLVLCALLWFYVRNYIFLLVLLFYFLWITFEFIFPKLQKYFAMAYIACAMISILFLPLITNRNICQWIYKIQNEFIHDVSKTLTIDKPIDPSLTGIINYFPQVVEHLFFRPYISECSKLTRLFSFAENVLIVVFILLTFFIVDYKKWKQPFALGLLFLGLSILLLYGYTVPSYAVLHRYKTFPLALIFISIIVSLKNKYHDKIISWFKVRANPIFKI